MVPAKVHCASLSSSCSEQEPESSSCSELELEPRRLEPEPVENWREQLPELELEEISPAQEEEESSPELEPVVSSLESLPVATPQEL